MIVRERLESILSEFFPDSKIAPFSTDWILSRSRATEDSVREVYRFLRKKKLKNGKIARRAHLLGINPETIEKNYQRLSALGLKDDKIASHAHLLGMNPKTIEKNYRRLSALGLKDDKIASRAELLGRDPKTIERNYRRLSALGLKDDKIASNAQLLGRDPETIERNYQRLLKLGLKDDKIASRAELLGMNPETIEKNYQRLSALGLKDDKIASRAELLGRDPETIERNYQHHVGLLRQNSQDRNSGRDILLHQAQLLGVSSGTLEANVQWFADRGVDYGNGLLLGTTPQTKRKKLAWILREIFDYKELNQEDKKQAIQAAYSLVRDNPGLLIYSLSTLEHEKDELRKKI